MALRDFRDFITTDANGYIYGDLMDANGLVVRQNVRFVPTNIQQPGDRFGAQAANLLAQIDDADGTAYLNIDEGQDGADRGTLRHFRAMTKPSALPPGRICVLPNGVAYIGNHAGLPSLLTAEINGGTPGAAHDSTKGYKFGDVWISGVGEFVNLLGDGFTLSSNWTVNSGVLTITGYDVSIVGFASSSGSTTSGVLNGSIGTLPAGHKIYVLSVSSAANTSAGGSETKLIRSASGDLLATLARGDETTSECWWEAMFTPSAGIAGAQFFTSGYRMNSFTPPSTDMRRTAIVDLTAAQGAGNEFTQAQAYAFFSRFAQWQPEYSSVLNPKAYRCFDSTPNAAVWMEA